MTPSPILHQNTRGGQRETHLPPMPTLTRLPRRPVPSGHNIGHRYHPYNVHQNFVYPQHHPPPVKQERVDWYPKHEIPWRSTPVQPFPFMPQQRHATMPPTLNNIPQKGIRSSRKWVPNPYPSQHQTNLMPSQHQANLMPSQQRKAISERPQELGSNVNETAVQLIKQDGIISDLRSFVKDMLTQMDVEDLQRKQELEEEKGIKNPCQLKHSDDTKVESAMDIEEGENKSVDNVDTHSGPQQDATEEKPDPVPEPSSEKNGESEEQAPKIEKNKEGEEQASKTEKNKESEEQASKTEKNKEGEEQASKTEKNKESEEQTPKTEKNEESEEQAPKIEYDVSSFIAVLMATIDGPPKKVDRQTLLPIEAFLELMDNYNMDQDKNDESTESESTDGGSQESESIPSPERCDETSDSDSVDKDSQESVHTSPEEVSDEKDDSEPELVYEKYQRSESAYSRKSYEGTESDIVCVEDRGNVCTPSFEETEVRDEGSSPSEEKESPKICHTDDAGSPGVSPIVVKIHDLSHLSPNDKGVNAKDKCIPTVRRALDSPSKDVSHQPLDLSTGIKLNNGATLEVRVPVVQFPAAYPPLPKQSLASLHKPLPKAVKCLTCFAFDKDLSRHMFFGQLQCKHCDHLLINCDIFRNALRSPERCPSQSNGGHVFTKWNVSPVDFLCYRIRKSIMNENKGATATFSEVLDEMEKYVQCLLPLRAWQACAQAIKRCTDYVRNMRVPIEKEEMRMSRMQRKAEAKRKKR